MYNLYNISLTSNILNISGITPAKITFDPSLYIESKGFGVTSKLVYQISYQFNENTIQDVIYTVYPSSYNLSNIYPLSTTTTHIYNSAGTHYCYISVYEIGTAVNIITATIDLYTNERLDLYLLKSSVFNVKNDTLYVFESEIPNLVLPVYLNWEKEKTKYIDPIYYPTPTITPSLTITPTLTPSTTPTPTVTPTNTLTPTPTLTNTRTNTPTTTPTPTVTPTITPTLSITPTITPTTTPTPTITPSPTLPQVGDTTISYRFSGKGIHRYKIPVPAGSSFVFAYDAGQVPDKFTLFTFDDQVIYTTGWAGLDTYNKALASLGEGPVESFSIGSITLTNNTSTDYILVEAKAIFSSSKGMFTIF